MKKKILIIFPKARDKRELSQFAETYDLHFHDYNIEDFRSFIYKKRTGSTIIPEKVIDEITTYIKQNRIDGIISTDDYPGSLFASIAAQKTKLPAPSPEAVIFCQHKYLSRVAQRKYVPKAAAKSCFIRHDIKQMPHIIPQTPFFIKPIKACFSIGAQRIAHKHELDDYLVHNAFPAAFCQPLEWAIQNYTTLSIPAHGYIAEEYLEGTHQVTIEGYVFQGNIQLRGIVDSIMYPGTLSFARFEYPSQLPSDIQKLMTNIAFDFIKGINFDNGMFNIEFMYNEATKKVSIIEVNSRMASQYADIYEKVDGTNSYQIALDIAAGREPQPLHKKGMYNCSASFVMRKFEDAKILSSPKLEDVQKMKRLFPKSIVEIIAQAGTYLSDYLQDGNSYRYCLVHLGAHSQEELMQNFETCKTLLPFSFETNSQK